jgi:hypothetical protein
VFFLNFVWPNFTIYTSVFRKINLKPRAGPPPPPRQGQKFQLEKRKRKRTGAPLTGAYFTTTTTKTVSSAINEPPKNHCD